MAVVPRVLLDHVEVDPAQREFFRTAGEALVEGTAGRDSVGELDLVPVGGEVGLGLLGRREVEVAVPALVGAVQIAYRLLPVELPAEPPALDLGEMADQAEQRQPGRRNRLQHQLFAGQAAAFEQQGVAVELQEVLQGLVFATVAGDFGALDLGCRPRSHSTMLDVPDPAGQGICR